jgi:RNA polymerase sigma-70 factor, ECF subfamily
VTIGEDRRISGMPDRPPGETHSDPAISAASLASAEYSCAAWYEAYGTSLYGFLRFHLPSADLAEDLTAEVFFRAVRAFDRFDPERGPAKAWLFRIAQNALRDYQRQAARRRSVSLSALRDLQSAAPSPEERLLWEEETSLLLQAVAGLPSKDGEVVSLYYGSGLSIPEVSELLGLSVSATRTRLWRALRRLRKALSE